MRRTNGELAGHLRSHARGLSAVALAGVIGVLSAFVFQVASARYLGAEDFGLFAAFMNIVSVAAVGSSSLQNIVTVQTAAALADRQDGAAKLDTTARRWGVPWEALTIGGITGIALAILAPLVAHALDTSPAVIIAAAICIPLSFVFADALGLLQGSGDVAQAVWWSTVSLVVRIVLLLLAAALGFGIGGVMGSVVMGTALAVVGAMLNARRVARPAAGAFTRDGLTILLLTVTFAWLTASDVIFLRAGAASSLAGSYAAVTVLVKAGFLVPSTLSLYLLPRFVRARDNPGLARIGVIATVGASIATSLAMIVVFATAGPWVIDLLYGEAYAEATALLVPIALAYAPWMAAQGVLIKMTSTASRGAAAVLLCVAGIQSIMFHLVVPDVSSLLYWLGALGVFTLVSFLVLDSLRSRRIAPAEGTSS